VGELNRVYWFKYEVFGISKGKAMGLWSLMTLSCR
jgi:hypothetical protein